MASHAKFQRPDEQLSRRRPGTGSIGYFPRTKSYRGRIRQGGHNITVYAKTYLRCEQKLLAVRNGGVMAEWEFEQKLRWMKRLRSDLWSVLQQRISGLEKHDGQG